VLGEFLAGPAMGDHLGPHASHCVVPWGLAVARHA
jgi:hypothetical protein